MILILIIFFILSFIQNKLIYMISKDLEVCLSNKIMIYLIGIIVPLLIYNKYKIELECINYLMLIPFITLISLIDFRTYFVYDITVVSGIIIQSIIFSLRKIPYNILFEHVEGLLLGLLLSFLLCKLLRVIGEGDIGFYGLCCFTLGIKHSLNIFVLSFFLTSIFGVYILIKNKKIGIKTKIPFTPFISLATIFIMLTGYDIINIYFKILYNR